MYIAFKLSENKRNFCQRESLLFRSQCLMCAIACPLLIHSNQLILFEIKVSTLNHGMCINIPYKVLKLNSKYVTWIAIHSYAQCAHLNYVAEFTCNKSHYNNEFNLKGQCVSIVYLNEAI